MNYHSALTLCLVAEIHCGKTGYPIHQARVTHAPCPSSEHMLPTHPFCPKP